MAHSLAKAILLLLTLHSEVSPGFLVLPNEPILKDGQRLQLACITSSLQSNTSIHWRKDGTPFNPSALGFSINDHNLSATFASSTHPGVYTCHPSSGEQEDFASCPTTIGKAYIETFGTNSKTFKGFVGGVAVLVCAPPNSAPQSDLKWTRRGSGSALPSNSRVLPNGDLHISPLKASDAGEYRCIATNSLLGQKERGRYMTLRVSSSTTITSNLVFVSTPPDTVMRSGESVILPCAARGFPVPQYTWHFRSRGSGSWVSLPHQLTLDYFNLTNVNMAASGTYRCTASTALHNVTVSASVTVKVAPISIEIVQRVKGDAILLTCDAKPDGDYDILWSLPKMASLVEGNSSDKTIGILRDPSSSGVYQCRVSNEFGCLTQETPVKIEPYGSTSVYNPVSSSLALHIATSAPLPSSMATLPVVSPMATSPVVSPMATSPVVSPMATSPVVSPMATSPVMSPMATSHVVSPMATSPAMSPMATSHVVSPMAMSPVVSPMATSPVMSPMAMSPVPSPMVTPQAPLIAFDPSGPISLEEGQNYTIRCSATVKGTIILTQDRMPLDHSLGAELQHDLVHVNKDSVGEYSCQLSVGGSMVAKVTTTVDVQAVRPKAPPSEPVVKWLTEKRILVSWLPVVLKPWQSVEGIKLNWEETNPPKKIARLSVPVENTSAVIDVNTTGLVFISVWMYNKAGDGPIAVLNVTISLLTTTEPPSSTTPTGPLNVTFGRGMYTAAVGETVMMTCRTNIPGPMEIFVHNMDTLSNTSKSDSVTYTLREVTLEDSKKYFCHRPDRIVVFKLNVVDFRVNCSVVSSQTIKVHVEPSLPSDVDIVVNYVKISGSSLFENLNPTHHSKQLPSTGTAILDELLPDTHYRIVVNKGTLTSSSHFLHTCPDVKTFEVFKITREMVAVTGVEGDTAVVSLIKILTELNIAGISEGLAEVQVQIRDQWQTIDNFSQALSVPLVGGTGVLKIRVHIGDGDWQESDVSFTIQTTTTPTTVNIGVIYATIIIGGILIAVIIALMVLIMKYVQIHRREKDKVTDHRVERLSRQSSVRSTVSWSIKQHSLSPDLKVSPSTKMSVHVH